MASYVTAVHTFQAEHGDELEFEAGDKIEVLERDDAFGDGWWRVSLLLLLGSQDYQEAWMDDREEEEATQWASWKAKGRQS